MLLTIQLVKRNGFPLFQRRQFFIFFFFAIIRAFLIDSDKARKYKGLAAGTKQGVISPEANIQADCIETRGSHLTGESALPDHFIEPRLINGEKFPHALRGASNRGWPYCFMSFLRILGFAFVDRCSFRQIVGCKLCSDITTYFLQGFLCQRDGIGTHITDQSYSLTADVNAFIKLLGDTHRAVSGHA